MQLITCHLHFASQNGGDRLILTYLLCFAKLVDMKLVNRFVNLPQGSFFLFGPRGTGKSTWLKQAFPDALWIDLLQPENLRIYGSYHERLREAVLAFTKETIIIDEVQKIPALLEVVHSLIEQRKDLRFILTGSSARKLKREGVNLLAGRAVMRHFHPFVAAELGDNFVLDDALSLGLLPIVCASKDPQDTLAAYVGLYLKEEVQAEGLVRNVGNFARFLEVISFSHGGILNICNIARESSLSRKLVEGYVSILQDLLLCHLLPVFTKRAKRETVMHPKFYYFDSGVFRSLRAQGPLDRGSEIDGSALEGLVLQHLVAWIDYQKQEYNVYYWRTRAGVEVDFIVYGTNGFWAIEVKNSTQVHPYDVRNLSAFGDDYPEAKLLLLYRGNQKVQIKNVLCLPVEEFLRNLYPQKNIID